MKKTIRKFSESVEIRSSLFNRLRSHRYFQWSLLGAVVLMVSCVHIWQRVTVLDLVHEVSLLRQEHMDLLDDTKKTDSEIAALSSASRIRQYASDSLNMVSVPPEQLYTLVRTGNDQLETDDMSLLMTAIRRATTYLPSVSSAQASAAAIPSIIADSLNKRGGER